VSTPFFLDNVDIFTNNEVAFLSNLGLNTYQQILINYPTLANIDSRLGQAMAITQAISGQWFGSFVTAKDWNLAFLHKGFSTFFAHRGLQEQLKGEDYTFMESKFVDTQDSALYTALVQEHAIVSDQPIIDGKSTDEYLQLF
jgi:aminopeptidase N